MMNIPSPITFDIFSVAIWHWRVASSILPFSAWQNKLMILYCCYIQIEHSVTFWHWRRRWRTTGSRHSVMPNLLFFFVVSLLGYVKEMVHICWFDWLFDVQWSSWKLRHNEAIETSTNIINRINVDDDTSTYMWTIALFIIDTLTVFFSRTPADHI